MIKTDNSESKNGEYVKKFNEKMKKRGYVWFCRWVPRKFKEKVDDFIKKLKE